MTATAAARATPPRRLRAVLTESRLFALGVLAIALHVLDDSFLQPQPGTSATDHLVSGLLPLALLGLAVWAHPRLSGGRRGALALAAGVLGLAAGGEAFHYAREVGASGDDYTGLLALPAGLGLLALGAATLWRTRSHAGRRGRRYGRRALLAVAGGLTFLFVVLPVGMAYVGTNVARPIVPAPQIGAHEDVTFETSDGLTLHGWYVPSRNGAAVIAFPGRKNPQAHTRMLARHGYGVLLFDRRGEGRSDGDPNSLGWGGEKDIEAAVAFLRRRPDVDPDRIGGLGLSVGGELMIEAAAEDAGLAAVASEGAGIRSLHEHMEIPSGAKWLVAPFQAVRTAATAVFDDQAPPPNLKELVAEMAPRPLLPMSSPRGVGGEVELNPVYARAGGETTTHWEIPGSDHMGGIRAQPEEYERRVVGFFDRALR
jgi:dienelactone hydrolase